MAGPYPCLTPFDWKLLLDGLMLEPQQTSLAHHLEACPACQQRLQDLSADSESWRALAGHLNADGLKRGEVLQRAMEKLRDKKSLLATQDEDEERKEIASDFLDPPMKPQQVGQLDPYKIVEVSGRGGMDSGTKPSLLRPGLVVAGIVLFVCVGILSAVLYWCFH
jgi:hypothetical protein